MMDKLISVDEAIKLAEMRPLSFKRGDVVKVGIPLRGLSGFVIFVKKPFKVPHTSMNLWFSPHFTVCAETEWLHYNAPKNVVFAYGIVVETQNYASIYFPHLLKSGKRVCLSVQAEFIYTDVPKEEKKRILKFYPEYVKLFSKDNFEAIEMYKEFKDETI